MPRLYIFNCLDASFANNCPAIKRPYPFPNIGREFETLLVLSLPASVMESPCKRMTEFFFNIILGACTIACSSITALANSGINNAPAPAITPFFKKFLLVSFMVLFYSICFYS